jgi:NAD(P)-dependent dehydrogenase (short-subunit alcohol dehydrogenase family)
VVLADRDAGAAEEVRAGFAKQFGKDVVRAVACDVTDEAQVQAAFAYAAREFGGLDVLVANAGIASSAPIEQTTWNCGTGTSTCWRKGISSPPSMPGACSSG